MALSLQANAITSDPAPKIRRLNILRGHGDKATPHVKWSPDGSCALSGALLWNVKSGRILSRYIDNSIICVSFSPDGTRFASGTAGTSSCYVIIWNVGSGEKIMTLEGHANWVQDVNWSPDSSKLVSCGKGGKLDRMPGDMYVWDANTGEKLLKLEGHANIIVCASWSPDGKHIVSGAYGPIFMWDSVSGERVREMVGHVSVVKAVCWSPDGSSIVSGCWDQTVVVWNARTGGKRLTLLGHSGGILSVHWSPDGTKLVSSGNSGESATLGEIFVWRAADGEKLVQLRDHLCLVSCVSWSPDSSMIASASSFSSVRIWALENYSEGEDPIHLGGRCEVRTIPKK